ncbi:acyltransferase family protein [Arthrobacter sp. ISL-28]|uniref:acyltransferase family protein n=1 Tax=Arthrobacter sp. ISL-28 TaxID=2819108 RepID=UPI0037C0318A
MGDSKQLRAPSRYTSLDGLRGLAAFVVLIHHCFLVSPQLSSAVDSNGTGSFNAWVWWTTFIPLHPIWAGQEAVYIFFILSALVLTLPFVGNSRPNWAAYFAKTYCQDLFARLGFPMRLPANRGQLVRRLLPSEVLLW